MSLQPPQNPCAQSLSVESLAVEIAVENVQPVPQTFADAIDHLKTIALEIFDREIVDKQLCYHTREHIEGVQRRASVIFQSIRPYLEPGVDTTRMALLLDLCAATHDLIQIFVPSERHTTRHRTAGVSETATIERLVSLMRSLNQHCPAQAAPFTDADLQRLQTAIAATICDYDPTEQAIFQPALYEQPPIDPIARILALADIGTLGMEGIEAYNAEGSLLFLEENPDVRSLLRMQPTAQLMTDNPALQENIRQRLLKRARFQVNFAKARLKRCPQELQGLPVEAMSVLSHEVFQYLSPATIRAIELTTPTAEATPLETLITFFKFAP